MVSDYWLGELAIFKHDRSDQAQYNRQNFAERCFVMNYYKYPDEESGIVNSQTYVETDENGCYLRQITCNDREYLASNVLNPPWGMVLGEGCVDFEPLVRSVDVASITKEEFRATWDTYLALRQSIWETAKHAYHIGTIAHGFIEVFYPQGVIVNLGDNALGIADYRACRASTQPEFMYPKHKITAVVSGYDDANQWITLTSPQVHSETIK